MRVIKSGKSPELEYRVLCPVCDGEAEFNGRESIGYKCVDNTGPIFRCPTPWCGTEIVGARLPDRNREAVAA